MRRLPQKPADSVRSDKIGQRTPENFGAEGWGFSAKGRGGPVRQSFDALLDRPADLSAEDPVAETLYT